jgi:ABC-type amino acid transport substrate-binding protein
MPPVSSRTRPEPAGSATAADANTTRANVPQPHPTTSPANSDAGMIEAKVAAARALAERMTAATPTPVPDAKAGSKDSSDRSPQMLARGDTEPTASANDADRLVAILMVRPEIKSVSDLAGKTIAIDDRYSVSNGSVRTAMVAAGATEVQLSEGQTTAINRLVDGEVPAAVLALVAPEAAERFPAIAGFKTFQVPLSPRALKPRP